MKRHLIVAFLCAATALLAQQNNDRRPNTPSQGQPSAEFPQDGPPPNFDGPPPFGPNGPNGPGFGPGRGPGGPGGMMSQETKILEKFDADKNGRLDAAERKAARADLAQRRTQSPNGRGFGPGGPGGGPRGPMGRGGADQPKATPGPKVSPADVPSFASADLYDPSVLRTVFLEFENTDWEKELADFNNTDVEVPARVTVDGKIYNDVGVHFRGMSSFMGVSEGYKRSLNLTFDDVHKDQAIAGYRTLNLLNSHEDPSFLRTVLYFDIAREYIPAPKANFVRVVINGESWGVYVNVQQFNKDFVKQWFGTTQGNRWKVPGSPGGQGSLAYLGEDAERYRQIYQIKSKDTPKAWTDLIRLCRTLHETPVEQRAAALEPILDIEGALRFLALENTLINNDGYWVRSSDYSIYQDAKGKFHILPHDANETFAIPGGPGFGGRGGPGMRGGPGRQGRPSEARNDSNPRPDGPPSFNPNGGPGNGPTRGGVTLDPLIAATDESKPLLSKLLAVPELRARYLALVGEIAERWLDWKKLGPIATRYHDTLAEPVHADTRKLDSFEAFLGSVEATPTPPTENRAELSGGPGGPRGGMRSISIKAFAEQRRAYLLNLPAVQAALPKK